MCDTDAPLYEIMVLSADSCVLETLGVFPIWFLDPNPKLHFSSCDLHLFPLCSFAQFLISHNISWDKRAAFLIMRRKVFSPAWILVDSWIRQI